MSRKHQRSLSTGDKILICDDDPDVRASLRSLLEREGHTVHEAPDGPRGVAMVAEHDFDLLLLDFLMPGMTGEEVVREIRRTHTDIQILLQTGYASEHPPREMLKRLDIQGYHDKSEGPEKLLIWVDAALKAARQLRAIRQSQRGLMFILNVTPEIYRIQPLEDLLQGIFLQLFGFLQARSGFVATVNPDVSGFLATLRNGGLTFPFRTGRYQATMDLSEEDRQQFQEVLDSGEIKVTPDRTLVPLVMGTRTVGLVCVECPPPLNASMELLRIFSSQAAVAIENLMLYDAVTHDSMTGVCTKSYFLQRFMEALQLAVRHNHPLSVMMVDIDNFKRLNDTYGHQLGDRVIIEFANSIGECLRTTDLIGRYGGDEFVVLLPETAPENAVAVAERIGQRIRAIGIESGPGDLVRVTTSIGIGGLEGTGEEGWRHGLEPGFYQTLQDHLLRTADDALYQSKKRGRDGYTFQRLSLDEVLAHGA